ncbi:hypothetical protein BCR44DRAFT_42335 [Catenaria anguillulae PL171]|uniref:Uncharacterized protein n=1 Tax=Catenaria anguillulae PL171 TaxID=765915 RepID=A0A1Y2HDK7_9FUNG|nr:hypothetical protein BCR44DRAFT_42335 [Catenaria anguillulae PL171]
MGLVTRLLLHGLLAEFLEFGPQLVGEIIRGLVVVPVVVPSVHFWLCLVGRVPVCTCTRRTCGKVKSTELHRDSGIGRSIHLPSTGKSSNSSSSSRMPSPGNSCFCVCC